FGPAGLTVKRGAAGASGTTRRAAKRRPITRGILDRYNSGDGRESENRTAPRALRDQRQRDRCLGGVPPVGRRLRERRRALEVVRRRRALRDLRGHPGLGRREPLPSDEARKVLARALVLEAARAGAQALEGARRTSGLPVVRSGSRRG